jgi:hypothetical protein
MPESRNPPSFESQRFYDRMYYVRRSFVPHLGREGTRRQYSFKTEFPFQLRKYRPEVALAVSRRVRENADLRQIDDGKARAELAKSIGLRTLPRKNWSAFDTVYGMLTDSLKHEKTHDSVAIVRRVRRGR